jgi:hypothetical protein
MTPPNAQAGSRAEPDSDNQAATLSVGMRVCRYLALGVTGLGSLLTVANPDGDGPVIGFVGVIAALNCYWWKTKA